VPKLRKIAEEMAGQKSFEFRGQEKQEKVRVGDRFRIIETYPLVEEIAGKHIFYQKVVLDGKETTSYEIRVVGDKYLSVTKTDPEKMTETRYESREGYIFEVEDASTNPAPPPEYSRIWLISKRG